MSDEQRIREEREEQRRMIRQQKINELNRQAQVVQSKIVESEHLKTDFMRKERQCIQLVEEWQQAESSTLSSQIVREVHVSKVFEGEIAEKQASELPKGLKQMKENTASFDDVISGVSDQISKLDRYISDQTSKLHSIRSQINSL